MLNPPSFDSFQLRGAFTAGLLPKKTPEWGLSPATAAGMAFGIDSGVKRSHGKSHGSVLDKRVITGTVLLEVRSVIFLTGPVVFEDLFDLWCQKEQRHKVGEDHDPIEEVCQRPDKVDFLSEG